MTVVNNGNGDAKRWGTSTMQKCMGK